MSAARHEDVLEFGGSPHASTCVGRIETPDYVPREAQATVLYGVVAEGLETFLARARERDRPLPRFVERELRGFLSCGIHAHGFVRVHCDDCGFDRLVPFSCCQDRDTMKSSGVQTCRERALAKDRLLIFSCL